MKGIVTNVASIAGSPCASAYLRRGQQMPIERVSGRNPERRRHDHRFRYTGTAGQHRGRLCKRLGGTEFTDSGGHPGPDESAVYDAECKPRPSAINRHGYLAGSAPGQIGVYQVNVQVPLTAPSGSNRLVLSVGGNSSQIVLPCKSSNKYLWAF